jgi:ribosomal protein S18 acetylase RimI-like enzyme
MSADGDVCAPHDDIALRAATDADMDFLRDVFSSTRMQEFISAGMSVEQAEALLVSQFSIQHAYYRQHYPHGRFDIIMQGTSDIGRLYHDWHGDTVQLIDIALLPAYRGAGIGTRLLRAIVADAAVRGIRQSGSKAVSHARVRAGRRKRCLRIDAQRCHVL